MKTVAGLFSSLDEAQFAVRALEDVGIPSQGISVIAGNDASQHDKYLEIAKLESVPTSRAAAAGASVGGATGFMAGLIVLAVPGVGAAIAGGALAVALGGMAVGAAGGALIGAFEDMGISREDAPLYEEAVRRGVVIVAAEVDDPLEAEAITILKTRGGRQVREEVAQFDPHPHPIDSAV